VYFASRIADHGLAVHALVANRVHPAFADPESTTRLRARATELRASSGGTDPDADAARRRLADRYETLADLVDLAARERALLADVAQHMGTAPVYVPFLDHDVHDLRALHEVGRYLVG